MNRPYLIGPGFVFLLCLAFCSAAHAGGPLLVGSNGVPETWANGEVVYYTDQGTLGPLSITQADQFVADAWAEWTSVPLASLSVDYGGRLSYDITGANFATAIDLLPDSGKPVAIVYDADGSVIDNLLGQGAGSPDLCSTNGVYGQVDSISEDGHIAHAIVVVNGNCAVNLGNLPVLHYQLVRMLGRVLGLDYSQLNENVVTGSPAPTSSDYAGYPVMHPLGVICTYTSGCMVNAEVPRMDDRAALARLYPGLLFTSTTARVSGTVRFPSWRGAIGQSMQGVNVVARLIDPTSGRVSTQYSSSSVSGSLFRGNAGNPVTGYTNALGNRWVAHGSSDPSLEGFYDLSGLEIPQGYNSATYEISVEPVNALYNGPTAVGPYVDSQVTTEGAAAKVRVTVSAGGEVTQDFSMLGAAAQPQDRWTPSSFVAPAAIPLEGSWTASLSGYGNRDYYVLPVQANRTLTFDVTAIDETGMPNVNRALPVIGLWTDGADEDSPALTQTYFNVLPTAMTRMTASINAAGTYKLGVMDYRGDGRPDFLYTAHLYYADQLNPAHVSVLGGSVVTIEGFGFTATTQVSVNGAQAATTYLAPNQVQFQTPTLNDGTYDVVVSDPLTGASSKMSNALMVGGVNAKLVVLNGTNPPVPVGTVAPNTFTVRVVDVASGNSITGATVLFNAPSSVALIGCSQSPCSVVSDQNGIASVQMLVQQGGTAIITASLPVGVTVCETMIGVASSLAIGMAKQSAYVVSGATTTLPVSATVVANNLPSAGMTVNFSVNYGTAQVSPTSAVSDLTGIATAQVTVTGLTSPADITACVAPRNTPCRTFMIYPVASNALTLEVVSGNSQTVTAGQVFAPLVLRVVDTSGNPVCGAPVSVDVHMFGVIGATVPIGVGDVLTIRPTTLLALRSSFSTVRSDINGLVTFAGAASPSVPVRVTVHAVVGSAQLNAQMISIAPDPSSGMLSSGAHGVLSYRPRFASNNLRIAIVNWY